MTQSRRPPPKVAFLLFPHSASSEVVEELIRKIIAKYPQSVRMISILQNRPDLRELALADGFFHFKTFGESDGRLVSRALPMLIEAAFKEVDVIFFHTALLRYNPDTFLTFVETCLSQNIGNLFLGEPKILHLEQHDETAETLRDEQVRKNLMVDVFTSYIMCKADSRIFGHFVNLNAGIFALRAHYSADKHGAIRSVLAMKPYRESDLLAPIIALHMREQLSLRSLPLDTINLDAFRTNLDRRIQDMLFVLDMMIKRGVIHTKELVVHEIFEQAPYLKVIFTPEFRDWFEYDVLGVPKPIQVKKLPSVIRGDPTRDLPPPEIKRIKK